ncbi:hypothetical protein H9Q69_002133 [Fusarium xylarioides]|nr:hypothetical protein H9Q70_001282 [Fusarium xylarioides]KAG5798805.1 hypothetical protein H9Q69_002133 [Fusarium xylarioides]KAG5808346.1 hypothetical protein H9Q71_007125 [Fusarium xylarioides]KAG5813441.1 hypothetical protein H9Q74_012686 [Fusarium xylarioides]
MSRPPTITSEREQPAFMCFGATCPTCSKKSWRGCGNHVQQVFDGVPQAEWCTCTPRTKIGSKEYPPAAPMQIPGLSWISGMLGGGKHQQPGGDKKPEL